MKGTQGAERSEERFRLPDPKPLGPACPPKKPLPFHVEHALAVARRYLKGPVDG